MQRRSENSAVKLTEESAGLYSNKIRSEIQYVVHTHAPGVVHTYVAQDSHQSVLAILTE